MVLTCMKMMLEEHREAVKVCQRTLDACWVGLVKLVE
jgi:hypothetical protein